MDDYIFRQFKVPGRMLPGLIRYKEYGTIPGSFLRCVLENDLMGALGRADDENLVNMAAYGAYLYNKMPLGCYGSKENVKAWAERFKSEE